MKRNEDYFIIELPLEVEIWQADIIDKGLEFARHLYNSLLSVEIKRYNEMIKTKKYRYLYGSLKHDKRCDHEIWAEIHKMEIDFGLTEYGFINDIKSMANHFSGLMNAQICQVIAKQVWTSLKSIMHKPSRHVHFKEYGSFNTLSGKQKTRAIIFKGDYVDFGKLHLRIKYPKNKNDFSYFERFLFPNLDNLKFCKIVRKQIRCKSRYYVQLVFKGNAIKDRYSIGTGRVGIDIGTSTAAISSDTYVDLFELAPESQILEKEKIDLQRKMDRSRRSTNPNKFNPDGTVKKGNREKWKYSKRYNRLKTKYSEICRKQATVRKLSHNKMTNILLRLGDQFFVEGMNFSGLSKRGKHVTEYVSKNRCKRKKRYGKSICNRAPAMFLTILDKKLNYFGLRLNKINTITCKASQYDHKSDTFNKKSLSDRWHLFMDGTSVQRDLYSAFLISNVSESLDCIDRDMCIDKFETFFELHNKKISELREIKLTAGRKFLTSIGI